MLRLMVGPAESLTIFVQPGDFTSDLRIAGSRLDRAAFTSGLDPAELDARGIADIPVGFGGRTAFRDREAGRPAVDDLASGG